MTGNEQPAMMAPEIIHDTVFELVQKYLEKKSRVLDLGAGQGAFSKRLKTLGHSVLAVDGEAKNWKVPEVELRRINLDCEFAAEIGPDEGFDAVVAIEIIEHLENPFSFARQCAALLKPGGLFFVTTPNVEAINSRIMFLYKGRLNYFHEAATLRTAHITPIFNWKMDMLLEEAGFKTIYETYASHFFSLGDSWKGRLSAVASLVFYPFVTGKKYGESRIVAARLAG